MRRLIIDCEINNLVNMHHGEPTILGFDFYVNDEDAIDTIEFIKEELKKNNLPLMCTDNKPMYIIDGQKIKIWTKDEIAKRIAEGYLISIKPIDI